MALRTLHIEITHADQTTPARGNVLFESTHALRDSAGNVVHGPVTKRAKLVSGEATLTLPPCDDPAYSPSGWTYTVTVDTDAWRDRFELSIPSAGSGTLEFADLAPATTPTTVATYSLLGHTHDNVSDHGGLTGLGDDDHPHYYNAARLTPLLAAKADQTATQTALNGKCPKLVVAREYITSGNIAMPNTAGAWQALGGGELAIPASLGDYVEVEVEAMRNSSESGFLDLAVIVGSSLVHYFASGSSSPAVEGDPAWYPGTSTIHYAHKAGGRDLVITADHLDAGQLRVVVACKSAGGGILYASTDYPFFWRLTNSGPVTIIA